MYFCVFRGLGFGFSFFLFYRQRKLPMPQKKDELRKKAEARLKKELLDIPKMSPDEAVKLLQELRMHQIELEMQNEELRRAQLDLEEARDKYSDLYDFAPVGYLTTGEKGLILEANLTACTLLGVERTLLIKQPLSRFILKEDQETYYHHRKLIFENKERQTCELRITPKDGDQLYAQLDSIPKEDSEGNIKILTSITEITLRKQLEIRFKKGAEELAESNKKLLQEIGDHEQSAASLKQSKENYRLLLETIPYGIQENDLSGIITFSNSAHHKILGYAPGELIGKPIWAFMASVSERENLPAYLATLVKEQPKPTPYFSKNARKDSRIIDVRVDWDYRHNEKGELTGFTSVITDITESKRMEEELLKAHKLESVGLLAGGIAHDFNNFLIGVLGQLYLAKKRLPPGDVVNEYFHRVENACLKAESLTKQLLTFAKGGSPVKETCDISGLLKESIHFCLSGSNVQGEIMIPENLRPVEVDKGQLNQVLHNLIINACQAMPKGGLLLAQAENVSLGAKEAPPLPEGKYVKICIKDHGAGIPEKIIPNIFDPYFTTKKEGTGLGLATSYSIIKKHDGIITLDSEPGEGTTFCIYLPASREKILKKPVLSHVKTKDEKKGSAKVKGKILFMDDEENIKIFIGEALPMEGFDVDLAGNGEEAVALYKKAIKSELPYDVVILDLTIPGGMGGLETIKKLMEIDPHVKAIVSSGYCNEAIMSDYRQYGFCDVMPKPYELPELVEKLQRIIPVIRG